jgi:hypothetical protein
VDISFVTVDAFAPDADPWVPVGAISAVSEESGDFLLRLGDETLAIRLSILSATCLRVRFSPRADADYETETSLAVIDRDIGPVDVRVAENTSQRRCAAGAERTGQGAGRDRRMRGPTRSAPAGPASQGQCAQEDRTTRRSILRGFFTDHHAMILRDDSATSTYASIDSTTCSPPTSYVSRRVSKPPLANKPEH